MLIHAGESRARRCIAEATLILQLETPKPRVRQVFQTGYASYVFINDANSSQFGIRISLRHHPAKQYATVISFNAYVDQIYCLLDQWPALSSNQAGHHGAAVCLARFGSMLLSCPLCRRWISSGSRLSWSTVPLSPLTIHWRKWR
jgi:hypothetical protein